MKLKFYLVFLQGFWDEIGSGIGTPISGEAVEAPASSLICTDPKNFDNIRNIAILSIISRYFDENTLDTI